MTERWRLCLSWTNYGDTSRSSCRAAEPSPGKEAPFGQRYGRIVKGRKFVYEYGKRILSLLLAAVLAAGALATSALAGEIDTDTVDLGNVKFIGVYAQAEETLRLTYTDYESGQTVNETITATVYTLFNIADTVVYTHSAVSKFMPYRLQAGGSYKQEGLGVQGGFKWTVSTFADRPAELYRLTPDRDAADVFFRVKDLTTGGGVRFSDVPGGAWYADTVKWAVEKGITTGTSATTFSPDLVCSRAQIVTFLYRYMMR